MLYWCGFRCAVFLNKFDLAVYAARSCHKLNVDYRSHKACSKRTCLGDLACGIHFNKVIIIPAKVANNVITATTITIRLFCTEARELR